MKNRSPVAVFLLPFVTFGIYSIVWSFKTRSELVEKGADIPTAWLLFVPIVNLYWEWKYSEGSSKIVGEKLSTPLVFVLLVLLGNIGQAIVQNEYNKIGEVSPDGGMQTNNYNPAPQAAVPAQPTAAMPAAPVQPQAAAPAPPATPPSQPQVPPTPPSEQTQPPVQPPTAPTA